MNLDSVPSELRRRRQWVLWKTEIREGKATKVPYNPHTRGKARSNTPSTWGTLEQTLAALAKHPGFDGIGFMFAADDPYLGVDLDNALEPDGTCKLWALGVLALFPDAYVERSPRGLGLHIIAQGTLPENSRHKVPVADGHCEAYDRLRFFTMTGKPWGEAPAEIGGDQGAVEALVATVLGTKGEGGGEREREREKRESLPVDLDDQALLAKMLGARNAHGVEALWRGETLAHGGDDSSADLALCNHLAFWTNCDAGRMDRLFRQSGLYREKWEREDYRARTIALALAGTTEGYSGPRSREGRTFDDEDAPPGRDTLTAIHEADRAANAARRKLEGMANGKHPAPDGKPEIYTAEDLQWMQFPEMKWVIPGILSEGLCLLAGPPKSAKSAFALQTAIATAAGGRTLGKFQVEQGEVLYIALEDTKRRMKDRMLKVLGGARAPSGLYFAHRWPKLGHGAEDEIVEWIENRSEARLVILDTFGKSRGPRKANGNIYDDDVATMESIQRLAQDRRVCVLFLHHTNKKVDPEDPFHAISGSEGVSGSTDTNLILRKPRAEKRGTLFVTGKDVDEIKYEVEFDGITMTWTFIGRSDEGPKTSDQAALLALIVSLGRSVTAKEVHVAMTDHGSKRSYSSVKGMMWRMFQDGHLTLQEQGRYALPPKH